MEDKNVLKEAIGGNLIVVNNRKMLTNIFCYKYLRRMFV